MKLNIKAFSLALGLFWGVGLFLITWWMIVNNGITHQTLMIGKIYIGYDVSPLGSIIGMIWGFFDGIIGGAIFAWLYNLISEKYTKA